jgi:Lrp/AsnC family leucine-responsive transcriptional regulator
MDTLDRKILSALQANARASLQEIGAAVGLSASPCWARIRKMEEAGVIEGYTVRLNPLALGLGDTVLVQVTLDSHADNTLETFGEMLATCCASSSRTRVTTSACCARSSTRSRAYATASPALCSAR